MERTSRRQVNVSLEQVRAHAEQSFASILLDIQTVDARLSRAAFGAQVGNEKYFLHIDQIFIRANGNELSVEAFQGRVFYRKYLFTLPNDQKVAQALLARRQDTPHHCCLEVNLQVHRVA